MLACYGNSGFKFLQVLVCYSNWVWVSIGAGMLL